VKWRAAPLFALVLLASGAPAHEAADRLLLVVDTDAGLDDTVAVALALQHPEVEIVSVLATPGATGGPCAELVLGRLLFHMNRGDVPLRSGAGDVSPPAPPFRAMAEGLVKGLLPGPGRIASRPIDPGAYASGRGRTTVLLLGPYTNLARALRNRPGISRGIEAVIAAGGPDGWNARFDAAAFRTVVESGVPLQFVVPGREGAKPGAWRTGRAERAGHTLGAKLLRTLLSDDAARNHYLGMLGPFHDELAFLYGTGSAPFAATGKKSTFAPRSAKEVQAMIEDSLRRGRIGRKPVVFSDRLLPAEALAEDVRARRQAIVSKNGEDEWFAQLIMHELHEHLGAWSVIGVKMAIRAAELLNAPPHAMQVVSRCAEGPPVSCLNDGVIAGSGSTPGRGLFRHEPGPPGAARVEFSWNGRSVTLAVKEKYRERIAAAIEELRSKHGGIESEAYWQGVRRLGLTVWEDWHRTLLFE
jgi:inosine-uridine nucleoside N-ribohydrolase